MNRKLYNIRITIIRVNVGVVCSENVDDVFRALVN